MPTRSVFTPTGHFEPLHKVESAEAEKGRAQQRPSLRTHGQDSNSVSRTALCLGQKKPRGQKHGCGEFVGAISSFSLIFKFSAMQTIIFVLLS